MIELPPSSKKLSWTPAVSIPRAALNIPASSISRAVRGATSSRSTFPAQSMLRLARTPRSALPLGLSGIDSRATTADGTMYSGSSARRRSFSPEVSSAPVT